MNKGNIKLADTINEIAAVQAENPRSPMPYKNLAIMATVFLALFLVLSTVGELLANNLSYQHGYAVGQTAGLSAGYRSGYSAGVKIGTMSGYQSGHAAGMSDEQDIITKRIIENCWPSSWYPDVRTGRAGIPGFFCPIPMQANTPGK